LLPLELLGAPEGSCLVRACLDLENLTVHLATTAPTAECPLCGLDTRRVHSRYTRRLDDLPCLGQCVRLQVDVRRFVCPQSDCPRRIFAERLPGLAEPWARTTDRLRQTQTDIASSLGGEAGARLAARMAITTSPDTLLRRVKGLPKEPAEPPRVVGIDDWAWRKGQRYGTIVVDLERSDVIDLLPDRDAESVAAWLKVHPGVEVISRDRSAAYAQAATEGAPQAEQVADRWHLLKNLREAVERVLERHSAVVDAALKASETPTGPACDVEVPETGGAATSPVEPPPFRPPSEPLPESPRLDAEPSKRQKRIDRFERVHELHRRGHSAAEIARELGLSRRSVFRYLRRQTCPAWGLGGSRRPRLDGYQEWIDARIAEGLTNAAELHRQLTERGFKGSYGSVYEFVMKRLGAAGKRRERINAAEPPVPARPSARQLSFEWARRAEKRKPAEQARLDAIRARSDELAAALDLADGFAELIRKRSRETLGEWLARGEASSDPDLRRFAEGIRRDEAAVSAAVTARWSNGPVEGHVNRLKTIKRQMYGRAGFVLLRARVLNPV
jgi:transposase